MKEAAQQRAARAKKAMAARKEAEKERQKRGKGLHRARSMHDPFQRPQRGNAGYFPERKRHYRH